MHTTRTQHKQTHTHMSATMSLNFMPATSRSPILRMTWSCWTPRQNNNARWQGQTNQFVRQRRQTNNTTAASDRRNTHTHTSHTTVDSRQSQSQQAGGLRIQTGRLNIQSVHAQDTPEHPGIARIPPKPSEPSRVVSAHLHTHRHTHTNLSRPPAVARSSRCC
jgi:hypothetical protein